MKKRLGFWAAGFVVLFLINVLVEAAILPAMGLSNTENNDLYFQFWWVVVAIWLVFGNMILEALIPDANQQSVQKSIRR